MPSDVRGAEKGTSKFPSSSDSNSSEDSKGRILSLFDNESLRTDPFGQNVSARNVYQRAERIVAGLYLVTTHISSSDPIRDTVRKESLLLLQRIMTAVGELRSPMSHNVRNVLEGIRSLITYVRVLGAAGFVSSQNILVLVHSLDELYLLVHHSKGSSVSDSLVLLREDLMLHHPGGSSVGKESMRRKSSTRRDKKVGIKDIVKDISDVSGDRVYVREERILNILKAGGLLGIKDIHSNVPEYSEKMIQRVLADLVQAHKVRKSGEKRWSKYTAV